MEPAHGTPRSGILFAEDFDLPEGFAHVLAPAEEDEEEAEPEPEVIIPSYSAEELEEAREKGFAAGQRAGREAAQADSEAQIAAALAAITGSLHDAREAAAATASELAEGVTRLLLQGLASLAPALCARHGESEVAAVMALVLPVLRTEPRITVRVNPTLEDGIRARLARFDAELVARVAVIAADLPPGDVRIGWRDGEAVRDTTAIWRGIADVLTPLGLLDSTVHHHEKIGGG